MLSRLQIIDWIETLAIERLQMKSSRLLSLLSSLAGDWEQVCFVALARALGFGLNGEPFEMLAKSLTLNTLARHSDNLLQIEALLFGQAGMLDASAHIFDEYYQTLCREYYFLARKYGLRPMRRDLWKYARTRPGNFPHRRVALLARYLEEGFSMFARVIDANGDEEKLRAIFSKSLDGYWGSHSSFDTEAASTPDVLSRGSVDSLLINVASPIYYAYGATIGNPDLAEKAQDLLSVLPPERNSLVRMLVDMGLPAANAMQSQALIHLRKEYCDCNKCLFCRFGHLMLRREVMSL